MTWDSWATLLSSTSLLTCLTSVFTTIIALIKKRREDKHEIELKKLENSEEDTRRKVVIDMINSGAVKIEPQEAKTLILKLLNGETTSDEAIKVIKTKKGEDNAVA